MIQCRVCHEAHNPEDFDKRSSRGDALRSTRCKKCRKDYYKKYYQNNKKRCISKVSKRKKKLRDWLTEFKSKKSCIDCKQVFECPEVLEFDHTGTDKRANVSSLTTKVSQEILEKEIAKCELVCANCHRIRTWNRRQNKQNALIA